MSGLVGGILLTENLEVANKVYKRCTQSREKASWYQHEEINYGYRKSNAIADVINCIELLILTYLIEEPTE